MTKSTTLYSYINTNELYLDNFPDGLKLTAIIHNIFAERNAPRFVQ